MPSKSLNKLETVLLPPVTFTAYQHFGVREIQAMQLREGIWRTIGPVPLDKES